MEESRSLIGAAIVGAMTAKWHKANFRMTILVCEDDYMEDIFV